MYLDKFKLDGPTAFITGGGRSIGLASAAALLDAYRHPSSKMNAAALAVLIVKKALDLPTTTYASGEGSNEWLLTLPPFVEAFAAAKVKFTMILAHAH